MSKVKKNRKTILLGALLVVVIIGICFTIVTLYAKNEINKPKFQIPETPQTLLTETLTTKEEAFAYAMQLYSSSITADNTEGSWKTDIRKLDEDWQTPFSKADAAIFGRIREKAGEQLTEIYPKADNVRLNQTTDAPQINKQASDVLDFTITIGRENDKKEIVDTDRYFLTLTFDPNSESSDDIIQGETFRKIADELSSVVTLSDTQVETKSMTMCFDIERINEELLSVEIKRNLYVSTTVRASDAAAELLEQPEGRVEMPYETTQKISFLHYGAHFREHAIAVKPRDIKALPAKVSTNAQASKDDYKLTFTSTEPELLSFDADGVMTVSKQEHDGPITVTMTLEYEGQTYTDDLTVYISKWEVATDVGA